MKKTLLLVLLVLTLLSNNRAQNFSFVYDAAGNRTDRIIVLLKSAVSDIENDTAAFQAKEEIINGVKTAIYPNPTRNDVFVCIQNRPADSSTELLLYDSNGKLLRIIPNPEDVSSIGLSNFPAGNYYLLIKIDDKSSQWKIIKQ